MQQTTQHGQHPSDQQIKQKSGKHWTQPTLTQVGTISKLVQQLSGA